jgi:hypothetical protein
MRSTLLTHFNVLEAKTEKDRPNEKKVGRKFCLIEGCTTERGVLYFSNYQQQFRDSSISSYRSGKGTLTATTINNADEVTGPHQNRECSN